MTAIPQSRWPRWVKEIARFKTELDQGIGDTIARTLVPIGGDAFKAWFLKTFGRNCKCAARQAKLNQRFPYENHQTNRSRNSGVSGVGDLQTSP